MEKTRAAVNTRKMVITAMLGAITIVLGSTPLGFIPVGPTKATIMHLPVIIGAILEGPTVGFALGLMFGIFSLIQNFIAPTVVSFVFWDPFVSVLPRLLIGIVALYTYRLTKSSMLAAAAGTLTNTVGVLGMIYLRHGLEFVKAIGGDIKTVGAVIMGIGTANGIPECIVAAIVTGAVVTAVKKYKGE